MYRDVVKSEISILDPVGLVYTVVGGLNKSTLESKVPDVIGD